MEAIVSLVSINKTVIHLEALNLINRPPYHQETNVIPTFHLSWQVAEVFDLPKIKQELAYISSEWDGFTIRTTGLGLFTGEKPVLYLPVMKNRGLLEKHEQIWAACNPYSSQHHALYSPESWQPHITILYENTSMDQLLSLIHKLLPMDLNLEFQILSLAVLYNTQQKQGMHFECTLKKGLFN